MAPRLSKLACLVICTASGVALAAELSSGLLDVAAAPKAVEPAATERAAAPGATAPGPADGDFLAAIEEHPLFTPGRHKPAPILASAEPAATAAPPSWNWRLSGIIVSGDQRAALFSHDNEKTVAAQGDMVDGWTVSAVEPDSVTIEAGPSAHQVLSPEPGQAKTAPPRNPLLAFAAKRGRMTAPAMGQELNAARAAFAASAKKMLVNPAGPLGKPSNR